MVNDVKPEQPLNAFVPILVTQYVLLSLLTSDGMVIDPLYPGVPEEDCPPPQVTVAVSVALSRR